MTDADPMLRTGARRRLIVAALLGTTIEFFDLYIYGLAAGLYFADQFFPATSSTAGVIASFGTLAMGFFIRPIGGIVGGHFGDRYGRKKVLVASMTIMGAGTFLVGVLPGYSTIGIAAPALLLIARLGQGLGAGAEYGGGALILVEHMDSRRRGFWASIFSCGLWSGIALGTLVFAVITQLPEHAQTWAWRVPFIASAGLVLIGLWVRLGVAESPVFVRAAKEAKETEREQLPIANLFRSHKKTLILGTLVACGSGLTYQIYATFSVSYADSLGMPTSTILVFQFVNGVFAVFASIFFGWLSDRVGRRVLVVIGSVLCVPSIYLLFWSITEGPLPMVMVSLIALEVGHSMVNAPLAAFLAEIFETRARYTGVSIAYQVGSGALAGLGPLAASAVLAASGGPPHVYAVPLIVIATSVAAAISAYLSPDRTRRSLFSEDVESDVSREDDRRLDPGAVRS